MKQDPHADLDITKDEANTFFAHRMTGGTGIKVPKISKEDQYYL